MVGGVCDLEMLVAPSFCAFRMRDAVRVPTFRFFLSTVSMFWLVASVNGSVSRSDLREVASCESVGICREGAILSSLWVEERIGQPISLPGIT